MKDQELELDHTRDAIQWILPDGAFDEEERRDFFRHLRLEQERAQTQPAGAREGGYDDPDAPLVIRVARPQPTDITSEVKAARDTIQYDKRKKYLWLKHTLAPFANPGEAPPRVFSLIYEMTVNKPRDADTLFVAPSDSTVRVGAIHQRVSFGFNVGGQVKPLPLGANGDPLNATAGVSVHTDQAYHFLATLEWRLRKVVGAPVGAGGARWQLFRQDESLDGPVSLIQVLTVPTSAKESKCTIKVTATKAGWLGTRWRAKTFVYHPIKYTIKL